jgi:hypothetical protein
MLCPLCRQRKAKRACPALRQTICAVCCGEKRLVEIRCPDDCSYLSTARSHPPAVVRRQRERDAAFFVPLVQDLSRRQYHLLMYLQAIVREARPGAIPRLADVDIADAAGALAKTFETASRGIIYEHQAASVLAQRVMQALQEALKQLTDYPPAALERDAAAALRRMERAARDAAKALGGDDAYLEMLDRLAPAARESKDGELAAETEAPRLILP